MPVSTLAAADEVDTTRPADGTTAVHGPLPNSRTVAVTLGAVVAISLTWNFLLPALGLQLASSTHELLHGVTNAGAQTVGAVLLWVGAGTTTGRRRAAWSTIAMGALVGAVGSWVWSATLANTGHHPDEVAIDTLYAAALLVTTVGVAMLPPTTERSLRVRSVDAAILMVTALTLIAVAPVHQRPDGRLVAGVETFDVYGVVTVLTILVAVGAVARCRPDRRGEVAPVAGALALVGLGSLLFAASPEGYPASSRLADTIFIAGFVLAAVAGARLAGPDRARRRRGSDPQHHWFALPEAATITTLVALTLHERFNDAPVAAFVLGGTAVALAIVRLLQLSVEQRRLGRSLRDSATQLHHEARTDALTGLGNRLGFEERLRTTVEHEHRTPVDEREPFAVMFVDVDHFKRFNDALGHAVGDGLLMEVARRLLATAGPHTYRIGGDEFVAVLRAADTRRAAEVAADVVAAFAPAVVVGDHQMSASVSVGLAGWDELDEAPPSAEQFMRKADLALYRSKALGRGVWTMFDPALADAARRQQELRASLQRAVDSDTLQVDFQPVVALRGHRLVGATARLRWRDQHGELEGEAVSAVAVEGGLVGGTLATLFDHTRRALLATAHTHTDATGNRLWIGVPLTRDELVHPDTRKLVDSTIGHPDIGAQRLRIDVTEDTVIDPTALDALVAIRALGVRITVERFGTGPSSLLSLDDYPADCLRLDRSFVEGLGRRRDDTVVVTTVTSLAPLLGLEVDADGITEEFQSTYLEGLGVLTGRGRLFGERLGVDELGAAAGQVRWLDTSLEATR